MSWRRMDFCDPPHRVAFAKSRTRASATAPCWPPLLHRCRGTLWTRTDSVLRGQCCIKCNLATAICVKIYMMWGTVLHSSVCGAPTLAMSAPDAVPLHGTGRDPRPKPHNDDYRIGLNTARVRLLAKATLCRGSQKSIRRQLMAWKGCLGCEAHAVGSCEQGCVVLCVESGKFSPHVCHRSAVCLRRCEANLEKREHACVDLCTSWLKRRGSSRPRR